MAEESMEKRRVRTALQLNLKRTIEESSSESVEAADSDSNSDETRTKVRKSV